MTIRLMPYPRSTIFTATPLSETPLVSVVTVAFNHAKFLQANITSVKDQGYQHIEHIIVDGGSTDGTVELLKTYTHLNWTSEPDQGQSDALNKGFRRARGEIIVWLNSDDQLAPGALNEVVARLRQYPLLIGQCQLIDELGRPTKVVPNYTRSWFDFYKYWISNSSPAQPSVFFTRELLEASKFNDTCYVDPELHYCMDYDLWLRMARLVPFQAWSDKILSIYPVYETSKTGGDWNPVYREMSRVFRRQNHNVVLQEAGVTAAITVSTNTTWEEIRTTLASLVDQTSKDFEVLFLIEKGIATSSHRWIEKTIMNDFLNQLQIRAVVCEGQGSVVTARELAESSHAPILLMVTAGGRLASNAVASIVNTFRDDRIGLIVAATPLSSEKGKRLQPQHLFAHDTLYGAWGMRTLAFQEIVARCSLPRIEIMLKEICLHMLHAGWVVETGQFEDDGPEWIQNEASPLLLLLRNRINAHIIQTIACTVPGDTFFTIRRNDGCSFELPDRLVAESKRLSLTAPPDWYEVIWDADEQQLLTICKAFPQFAAAHWLLQQKLSESRHIELPFDIGKQLETAIRAEAAS